MERILEIKGFCNARDCAYFGICCTTDIPKSAPAVLVRGGLHKLSDALGRFPEVGQPWRDNTFITVVEEVRGAEPIRVGEDLLFASTGPARLEVLFAIAAIQYVPNGGTRQVRQRWLRKFIELKPLNQGLIGFLARALEAKVPLIEVKPPNEIFISDIYTGVWLIFGEDGKVASKSGDASLTWFSEEGDVLKELIQSVA